MAKNFSTLFEEYVVAEHGGNVTRAAIEKAYATVLGLTGDFTAKEARIDWWVAQNLSAADFGAKFLEEAAKATPAQLAAWGENAADRNGKIQAASSNNANSLDELADIVGGAGPVDPGTPGDSFSLTAGRDTLTGTANDDVFTANVVQNDFGNLVNSLATGDVIEGNGGNNILKAQLINAWGGQGQGDTLAVMPMTNNVQTAEFQALNMGGAVTVDAVHMNGTNHYASVNSRGDLNIVNVRIENAQITEDITLEMRNTAANNADAGGITGSNLNVWFEQTSLRAAPDQTDADAEFFIELADAQQDDPAAPLANVRITDLKITHDGNVIELQNIESTDDTYQGLVEAIQAALDAAGFGDRYKATLGTDFNEVNGVATQVPGFKVVVEDTKQPAVAFTEDDVLLGVGNKLGVGGSATVLGDSGVDFSSDTTEFKVTSSVILDNVGMGSHGGNLFVGSMSDSASSTGIQVFKVEVRNNSNIGEITTTTTADETTSRFDELHITNGTNYSGNLVFRNTATAADGTNINGGDLIKAEGMKGNLNLGSENAISNVDTIDARIEGNVTINAAYDGSTLPSEKQAFAINTGTGNDVITASVVGNSTSGSTDTSLTVTAQGGNNTITLSSTDAEVTKATVITGTGADIITGGATHLTVNSGAGNDVIYAENTGDKAEGTLDAGDAAFSAIDAGQIQAQGNGTQVTSANLLAHRKVVVTLGVDAAAVAGTTGFESLEVEILPSNGSLTTERDLYEAVAKAINTDPVLKYLAKASVDSNGNLEVEYLIDGITAADDVSFTITGEWNDLTSQQQNRIVSQLREDSNNSSINAADVGVEWNKIHEDTNAIDTTGGVDSTAGGGANTINAGTGNDIIVLSSDDATVDTVIISSGSFGKNTIVHFNDGAAGDKLRFDFLDNQEQLSGTSTTSRDVIGADVAAATAMSANTVTVVDFSDLTVGGTVTFANMTTANLLSALNNGTDFAVAANAGLVAGSNYKSILLIQNVDNEGEYKVVEVTASGAGDDTFTGASIVGTLDFGAELTLVSDNIA